MVKCSDTFCWVRLIGRTCSCRQQFGSQVMVSRKDLTFAPSFWHLSIGELKKQHICEIFIPEINDSVFGIVKSFVSNSFISVEIVYGDPELINILKRLESPIMKWNTSQKLLEVKHALFIRSIFEPSHPVFKHDLCEFFLPGIGIFDVVVNDIISCISLRKETEYCEIQFVDDQANENVKQAASRLGEKFFMRSAFVGSFLVKREFLRKKIDSSDHQPLYGCYNSSNYESQDGPILTLKRSNEHEKKEQALSEKGKPEREKEQQRIDDRQIMRMEKFKELEEAKTASFGRLCCVNEDYMKGVCTRMSEHYGTVYDVFICKNDIIFVVELINSCDCKIITNGSFGNGKYYTEKLKVGKYLFVEKETVHVIHFSDSDLESCQLNDICEVFIPLAADVYFGRYLGNSENTGRLHVKMLENIPDRSNKASNYMHQIYDDVGLITSIHRSFVRPVFRKSPLILKEECEVFIPRKGVFHGVVLGLSPNYEKYTVMLSEADSEHLKGRTTFCETAAENTVLVDSFFVREKQFHNMASAEDGEKIDVDCDDTQSFEENDVQINSLSVSELREVQNESKNADSLSDQPKHFDSDWEQIDNTNAYKQKYVKNKGDRISRENSQEIGIQNCGIGSFGNMKKKHEKGQGHIYNSSSYKTHLQFKSYSTVFNDNRASFQYASLGDPSSKPLQDGEPNNVEVDIKLGDFCTVDKIYMRRLCDRNSHYGNVFIILPLQSGKPGAIVGLKLINGCVCQTITDGTYQGQLMSDKPYPSRCLFINVRKLKPIRFDDAALEGAEIGDVCQAYVPSLENHYYGVIRKIEDPRDYLVQILDSSCQYNKNFNVVNPELQQNALDSADNVFIILKRNFVKTLFRCSRIKKGDICLLFVPGQGKFQCLIEGLVDRNFEVSVLEGNIDMAKVNIDKQLFEKIDENKFCACEIFLECVQSTRNGDKEHESISGTNTVEDEDDESTEADVIVPDTEDRKPKPFVNSNTHVGRFKGIQGKKNSSCLDSLLYSLFLFNDSLDQIFELKHDDELMHIELKNQFKRLIVNPLRSDNCFVKQEHVMHLREMLEPFLPGVSKDEKDAEELLSVLFSNNFAGKEGYPPLLHFNNAILNRDQHMFVYKVSLPTDNDEEFFKMQKSVPHIADILGQSFTRKNQFLKDDPHTFIIEMSQFGREKMFPGIYLPAILDISELSAYVLPKCCICEDPASLRCRDCTLMKRSNGPTYQFTSACSSVVNFCQGCFYLFHKTKLDHQSDSVLHSGPLSGSKSTSLYSLTAVICIQMGHFFSFVRAKKEEPEGKFCWLFFDSMAEEKKSGSSNSGYNVPVVKPATYIEFHLSKMDSLTPDQRYDYMMSYSSRKEHEHLRSLVQDAFLCVYKQEQNMESEKKK